jgi:hypothetical protein
MTEKIKLLKRTGIFLLITGTLLVAYRITAQITGHYTTKFNMWGTPVNMWGTLMIFFGVLLYWCIPQYIAKEVAKRIIKWTGMFILFTGYLLFAYGSMANEIHVLGPFILLFGAFLY